MLEAVDEGRGAAGADVHLHELPAPALAQVLAPLRHDQRPRPERERVRRRVRLEVGDRRSDTSARALRLPQPPARPAAGPAVVGSLFEADDRLRRLVLAEIVARIVRDVQRRTVEDEPERVAQAASRRRAGRSRPGGRRGSRRCAGPSRCRRRTWSRCRGRAGRRGRARSCPAGAARTGAASRSSAVRRPGGRARRAG